MTSLKDLYCLGWIRDAVDAALKLGIPDALGPEPVESRELAARLGLEPGALYRLLRALSAYGIFTELEGKRFAHNDTSRSLRGDHPRSYAPLARLWGHRDHKRIWEHFFESIRDGRSAIHHAHGKPLYEALKEAPALANAFHGAMRANSLPVARDLAKAYPFGAYGSVLDLGGGGGAFLSAILDVWPHLVGAILDLPELRKEAEALSPRARFIEGNFLEAVPEGFDLYVIKNSLWNWPDDQALRLLRNVKGRLLIIEYLVDPQEPWTAAFDLEILAMPGGRARTREEYRALLADAGFEVAEVLRVKDQTVIEAVPTLPPR